MVILQSHRTQNMILRCYPNVSASNIATLMFSPYYIHLQSDQLTFKLSIDYCPPGYELRSRAGTEDLLSCTCLDSTFSILGCDDRRNVIFLTVDPLPDVTGVRNCMRMKVLAIALVHSVSVL